MKKITLLFSLVIAIVFTAQAQFPQDFETTVPPTGWVSFRGTNGLGIVQDWKASTTFAVSGVQSAFISYESAGATVEDWLVTSQFTPSASANVLSFQQRQQYTAVYNSVYTIRVSTASQTAHGDFTIIDTQTEANVPLGAWGVHYVDLSAYNGVPIYVAFVMANDDGDNWYVDDVDLISASTPPGCSANPTPADMATNVDIPGTDLTFAWDVPTTGDAPTNYVLELGTTSGTYDFTATTSDPTVDFTGLAYNTTYYWKVTPLNAGGEATGCNEWSFTTGDAPPTASNDACSGANAITALPYSFSQTDGPTSTNNAGFITACTAGSGGMNDGLWFTFTPSTSGTVDIVLSNVSASFDPQLDLYSGSCGTLTCIANTDIGLGGEGETITAQAVTAGTQYFINVGHWSQATDAPEGNFDINITGTATMSLDEFENAHAYTYFPNPVKSTLNLKAQSIIENVAVYNMLGQEVLSTSPNKLNSEVDMASLQTGTYFVKVTINNATETIRVIKQ